MKIAITGTNGAGKGTAVEYFKKRGFKHLSVRDFLSRSLDNPTRENLINEANRIREIHGPTYIIEQLLKEEHRHVIIESIRAEAEAELAKSECFLLGIDADPKIRYERIIARKSVTDKITYEDFKKHEELEWENKDPNKQNIKACLDAAEMIITNNGTIKQLNQKLEEYYANRLVWDSRWSRFEREGTHRQKRYTNLWC
jgi:dephospho-CoA kinase